MIRRLILENWRNYLNADMPLSKGTTFVVASNGVGKTSFVEAARWALFGSTLPTSPARFGTERTSATVELVLPDSTVLTANRVWDNRKTKPVHQLTLTRDSRPLQVQAWEDLCVELFGCSTDLLEKLTMPTLGVALPSSLGLHEHLSALYGVDNLNEASTRLAAELRSVAKEIAALKNANAVKAAEFDAIQTRVDAAAVQVGKTKVELEDAERQLNLARLRDERLDRAAARLQERAQIEEAQAQLLRRLGELLGEPLSADRAIEVLDQRSQSARSNLEALRLELQLVAQRRQDIERDLAGLDAATSECPTCRRPLDDEAREHAHALWRIELAELDEREAAARQAEPNAVDRVSALGQAQIELAGIGQRASALAALADQEEIAAPSREEATQIYRAAAEADALARDTHQRAQAALDEARAADENLRRLEGLFAREARLEIAKNAAEATREEILNDIVEPLAEAINVRWSSLFPDRGSVRTEPDGTISRSVGDHSLTFEAFSTAEGTAALIIMRLLVAQMTTKATFAWFDEPLEHLDPDVRRNVASLMTKVTADGSLEQVVVTTYEETLARKLQERSPGRTTLLDVRQEDLV
jgi:DNA repair exonuclease SbcCD ATPase subunit